MAQFINSGKERGMTLTVVKKVGGVNAVGYPKFYSILNSFTFNGNSYPTLREDGVYHEFSQLPVTDYLDRLTDFKAYVEAAEFGLVLDAVTSPSALPYRENTTSCPIGA